MSSLHSLVGHEVEAENAMVPMAVVMAFAALVADQLMQWRIARRALGGIAQLENVFGSILRVQFELMNGPLLHRTHASAGGKLALGGFFEEVNRCCDTPTVADMDAAAMFETTKRITPVTDEMLLSLVDENERVSIEGDALGRKDIMKLAHGAVGKFGLKDAGAAMHLNENSSL
jgi:hypothetical protein